MPVRLKEEDEEYGKDSGQNDLFSDAVVISHGDGEDLVALEADHHHGLVAGGEELVLLQRAVEQVDAGGGLPLKAPAQQLKRAALLAGADQTGVDDGGVVHRRYQSGTAVGLPVLQRPFKSGGGQEQNSDQGQTEKQRSIVAPGLRTG